jgi:farnesyl diphosphate synthase
MDFPQQLQACVEQANEALRRFIAPQPFQNTPLVEAMHYGALLGGKRLRPFLVYATGEMFGVSRTTLDAPAAAVECIHAYSLMHDDLPAMDDDDLRRGLPTCHIKFGEANAILAGDALQTLAFSILSDAPMTDVPDRDRLAMVSELAQASGVAGMCGGQALDLQAEGQQVNLQALEPPQNGRANPRRRPHGGAERRRARACRPARAGSLCGKYRPGLPGPG